MLENKGLAELIAALRTAERVTVMTGAGYFGRKAECRLFGMPRLVFGQNMILRS